MIRFLFAMVLGVGATAVQAQEFADWFARSRGPLIVTFSPAPLLAGVVQGSVEQRYGAWGGVLLGGFGGFTYDDGDDLNQATFVAIRDFGAQVRRYYGDAPRHRPHTGVQALWFRMESENDPSPSIEVDLVTMTAGPFIGYQYAAARGLILEAQIGMMLGFFKDGLSTSDAGWRFGAPFPVLNVGAGWGF